MSSYKAIQSIKGTQDILPEESYKYKHIENTASEIAEIYGFRQIRVPTFESTAVFTGSVGESSDIVQKEMYTFIDKGERSLTLRPEMTAGVVRSMIQNGLLNQALPQKVYYVDSCFRQEKPQSGRYREFHQFGIECFGSNSPSSDAEIIALANDVLDNLGITNTALKINSIGCPSCREKYYEKLKEYFSEFKDQLDTDSLNRLDLNPMRILDSKVPDTIKIVKNAPLITDYLCDECSNHFNAVKDYLNIVGLKFEVDPMIVRGLDYYTNTVFEFISNDIGTQGTVCGGGRYNLLVERRGGKPTPALGFAMGIERLYLVMKNNNIEFPEEKTCDLFIASIGNISYKKAFELSQKLRVEGLSAEFDTMERSLKAQMKYANKIGAKYTIVIGENEIIQNKAILKNMNSGEQIEVTLDESILEIIHKDTMSNMVKEIQNNMDFNR